MIDEGFSRGDERVVFLLIDDESGGARDRAPMIENARNVMNLVWSETFYRAQCEIPILTAFEAFAEASNCLQTSCTESREMAGVILPEEKIGIPIRFEVRIEASAEFVDLVLV
jgi:hypothetical protein